MLYLLYLDWKGSFQSKIRPLNIQPRPYGKPGRLPKTAVRLATSVALLIELEAQFYKLVTINQCPKAYTCEMVNKSSKSNLCYIDSDPIVM